MSTADRQRDRRAVSRAATQRTQLPGLFAPTKGDPETVRLLQAMRERLEVREGERGNPYERVVTRRDLVQLGLVEPTQVAAPALTRPLLPPGVVINTPTGPAVVPLDEFANQIRSTRLFADLMKGTSDPTRFDDLPQRVREIVLSDLGAEAQKRGADIRRLDQKIQSAQESFAQSVTTITAAVQGAVAGVRQVQFASATANRATAGQVTQVTARLDNFNGGGATVEQSMTAVADRATGLEAKYTVKVTAGGAVAGFGLASTSNTAGASSAFIIQADKFAIVSSSYAGGLDTTPDVTLVPFGVDSSGVYVNAPLNINGTTGINLRSGTAAVGKIKLDSSSHIVVQSTVANRSIGLFGPNGGGMRIDDFTSGGNTEVKILSPNGTPRGYLQALDSGGPTFTVGSNLGQDLQLRGGIGSNNIHLNAAAFAFPGAAKLVVTAYNMEWGTLASAGTGTASFVGANKPGLTGTQNNQWMVITHSGNTFYVPVWQ